MFRLAGTAEIMRAHQKDNFYLSFLRSSVADLTQTIAGPHSWLQWRRELDIFSDVVYFLLTTFGGYQTIGEEYVNILMVDGSKRFLPSKLRRAIMIGLQVCAPYLLRIFLDKIERRLQSVEDFPLLFSDAQRERVLQLIHAVKQAVTLIHLAHLSLFYIQGLFYHLTKRFMGIQFVRFMARQENSQLSHPFKLLGYLSLAQLVVTAAWKIYNAWSTVDDLAENTLGTGSSRFMDDSIVLQPSLRCSLCLGPRSKSTLTVCGHLFCWYCIHQWCQQKAECPLCREQLPPHRLVALQNYDHV